MKLENQKSKTNSNEFVGSQSHERSMLNASLFANSEITTKLNGDVEDKEQTRKTSFVKNLWQCGVLCNWYRYNRIMFQPCYFLTFVW